MRRKILAGLLSVSMVAAIASTSNPALAQEDEEADGWTIDAIDISTVIEDSTLTVTAGYQESLKIAARPGRGSGPSLTCVWHILKEITNPVDFIWVEANGVSATFRDGMLLLLSSGQH